MEDGRFIQNTAGTSGGALHLLTRASQEGNFIAKLTNTIFQQNTAGGAISNTDQSIVTVTSCTFTENSAEGRASSISTMLQGQTTVETSTFTCNTVGSEDPDFLHRQ